MITTGGIDTIGLPPTMSGQACIVYTGRATPTAQPASAPSSVQSRTGLGGRGSAAGTA